MPCASNHNTTFCACSLLAPLLLDFERWEPLPFVTVEANGPSSLNMANLQKTPSGGLALLVLVCVFIFLTPFAYYVDTKEADGTVRSEWVDSLEMGLKVYSNKEEDKRESFLKAIRLSHLYALLFREIGDNYSSLQRLCVLFSQLVAMMGLSAVMIASNDGQRTTTGVLFASAFLSAFFGGLISAVFWHSGSLSYREALEYQAAFVHNAMEINDDVVKTKKPERLPWYGVYIGYVLCIILSAIMFSLTLSATLKFNTEEPG